MAPRPPHEPPSGAPVTADDVISWFGKAGRGLTSTDPDVMVIVDTINAVNMAGAFRKLSQSPPPPIGDEEAYDRARRIRVSLSDLRKHLPWLLDQHSEGPELPEVALLRQLKNIVDTLFISARYLFPSRQSSDLWEHQHNALVEAIERVLRSAGRRRLSCKAKGPLAKVVGHAFKAIGHKSHEPTAVESFLKRRTQPDRRARRRRARAAQKRRLGGAK